VASYGSGGRFHRCGCGHSWLSDTELSQRIAEPAVPYLNRVAYCPECGGASVVHLGRGIQRCPQGHAWDRFKD